MCVFEPRGASKIIRRSGRDPGHHFDRAVLCHIQEFPKCPEEDFKKLFMTRKDFERIDTDVKMTVIRWTNHLKGRIKFDTEVNTIRGLEEVLDEDLASQKYKINYQQILASFKGLRSDI